MKTLVVGASGTTGKHLVEQLLSMGQQVKLIVRSTAKIPEHWKTNENIALIEANVTDLSIGEMQEIIKDCGAAASCLGHNLNLKGIYGKPRKLVADSVSLICDAAESLPDKGAFRFVLMNTSGNSNRDLNEPIKPAERIVMGIIRALLPPQTDNEKAADHLRVRIGQNHQSIEWVAVRPDGLINEDTVSEYETYPSPIRSAVFNPGKTSRINVGNFMARLIVEDDLWKSWKGQMPLIYNKE